MSMKDVFIVILMGIASLAILAFAAGVLYLAFAMGYWEWDFSTWGGGGRGALSAIWLLLLVMWLGWVFTDLFDN